MDSSTTHGTSSASMILLATVVFPEALPPHNPAQPQYFKGSFVCFPVCA